SGTVGGAAGVTGVVGAAGVVGAVGAVGSGGVGRGAGSLVGPVVEGALGGGSPVGAAEPVGSSSGPVVSSTTVGPAASFWPTSTDSSNQCSPSRWRVPPSGRTSSQKSSATWAGSGQPWSSVASDPPPSKAPSELRSRPSWNHPPPHPSAKKPHPRSVA